MASTASGLSDSDRDDGTLLGAERHDHGEETA
jgi:hypothetical protein